MPAGPLAWQPPPILHQASIQNYDNYVSINFVIPSAVTSMTEMRQFLKEIPYGHSHAALFSFIKSISLWHFQSVPKETHTHNSLCPFKERPIINPLPNFPQGVGAYL